MGERKGVRVNYGPAELAKLYPAATEWRLERPDSTSCHTLVIYESEKKLAQHNNWTSVEFEDAK